MRNENILATYTSMRKTTNEHNMTTAVVAAAVQSAVGRCVLWFAVRTSHIRSLSIEISISMPLNEETMISHIFFLSRLHIYLPLCVLNESLCCDSVRLFRILFKTILAAHITYKSVTTKHNHNYCVTRFSFFGWLNNVWFNLCLAIFNSMFLNVTIHNHRL